MTRKAGIAARQLTAAVDRLERGAFDADLGQKLYKQRVAREGQGKRGGYRLLVAWDRQLRAVFLFGFAKNEKANLDQRELEDARALGNAWLAISDDKVEQALHDGQLIEVEHDGAEEPDETLAASPRDDRKR